MPNLWRRARPLPSRVQKQQKKKQRASTHARGQNSPYFFPATKKPELRPQTFTIDRERWPEFGGGLASARGRPCVCVCEVEEIEAAFRKYLLPFARCNGWCMMLLLSGAWKVWNARAVVVLEKPPSLTHNIGGALPYKYPPFLSLPPNASAAFSSSPLKRDLSPLG